MDNKNTVIALVLMTVVWLGFSLFFPQQGPQEETSVKIDQAVETESSTPFSGPVQGNDNDSRAFLPQVNTSENAPVSETKIVIENDFFRATLSSVGGRIESFQLKNYQITTDPESPDVQLVQGDSTGLGTLQSFGTDGLSLPRDAVYKVDTSDSLIQITGKQSQTISFTWVNLDGFKIEKTYSFTGDLYQIKLSINISNQSQVTKNGALNLSLVRPWSEEEKSNRFDFHGGATFVDNDLKLDSVDKIAKESKEYKNPVWSGFETKYFLEALIPIGDEIEKVTINQQNHFVRNVFQTKSQTLASGETKTFEFLAYFGPLDLEVLQNIDHRLDEAVDFGFFSPLALPLKYVLNFFYSFVGNYGVAIVLLTVIIKLLFWPLTQKSYSSMKEMQKLQPEMQRIREKYKNDREKMNLEVMKLYKDKRVNPLGGCLPMIVQIPVFFALYKVLMVDIGLRHAPFVFWITDLSNKDPYYITPLIMGGTMFVQQKMTPSTMDPKQAKIFMFMPVIFTVMFLNFPSGLVVYWLVNNLLTILQQYFIHKKK